jgi:hypothetical protein
VRLLIIIISIFTALYYYIDGDYIPNAPPPVTDHTAINKAGETNSASAGTSLSFNNMTPPQSTNGDTSHTMTINGTHESTDNQLSANTSLSFKNTIGARECTDNQLNANTSVASLSFKNTIRARENTLNTNASATSLSFDNITGPGAREITDNQLIADASLSFDDTMPAVQSMGASSTDNAQQGDVPGTSKKTSKQRKKTITSSTTPQ